MNPPQPPPIDGMKVIDRIAAMSPQAALLVRTAVAEERLAATLEMMTYSPPEDEDQ